MDALARLKQPVSRVREPLARVKRRLWNDRRPPGGPLPMPNHYDARWEPWAQRVARFPDLISQGCTEAQIETAAYREIVEGLHQPLLHHRKQWEWCYVVQALTERGLLAPGADARGLGFGVGTEPLGSYFAARGACVLGTDQPLGVGATEWAQHEQHATGLDAIHHDAICPRDVFNERVAFRAVDMLDVPRDLTDFDFTWSCCALEHLGTLQAGFDFVERSLECLRPGGTAVHTLEHNVSSDEDTIESGPTVVYRRRDIRAFARHLRLRGHRIRTTFFYGRDPGDRHVDLPPFTNMHLKVNVGGYVSTSYGLLVTKSTR